MIPIASKKTNQFVHPLVEGFIIDYFNYGLIFQGIDSAYPIRSNKQSLISNYPAREILKSAEQKKHIRQKVLHNSPGLIRVEMANLRSFKVKIIKAMDVA